MANEIVKYQNRLNDVAFRRFTPAEMNIVFAIFSRVRDKGSQRVELTFDYLKKISSYHKHDNFVAYLKSVSDKILDLTAVSDDGEVYTKFTLFNEYTIDRKREKLGVSVNANFVKLFNELTGNWTRFSLQQFTTLESAYSKTIFRLVKQLRTQGQRTIKIEDFRRILDIPKSYRTSHIDQRVIKVAKEELAPLFADFDISKNYGKAKRGKKLISYTFSWKPEAHMEDDFEPGKLIKTQVGLDRINSNQFLSEEEKNYAIDRFLKLKLGTTEKRKKAKKELIDRKADGELFFDFTDDSQQINPFKDLNESERKAYLQFQLDWLQMTEEECDQYHEELDNKEDKTKLDLAKLDFMQQQKKTGTH